MGNGGLISRLLHASTLSEIEKLRQDEGTTETVLFSLRKLSLELEKINARSAILPVILLRSTLDPDYSDTNDYKALEAFARALEFIDERKWNEAAQHLETAIDALILDAEYERAVSMSITICQALMNARRFESALEAAHKAVDTMDMVEMVDKSVQLRLNQLCQLLFPSPPAADPALLFAKINRLYRKWGNSVLSDMSATYLGGALVRNKHYESALKILGQSVGNLRMVQIEYGGGSPEMAPEYELGLFWMGEALDGIGLFDDAQHYFLPTPQLPMLARTPGWFMVSKVARLVQIYIKQERYQEALEELERFIHIHGDEYGNLTAELAALTAKIHATLGNLEQSHAEASKARQLLKADVNNKSDWRTRLLLIEQQLLTGSDNIDGLQSELEELREADIMAEFENELDRLEGDLLYATGDYDAALRLYTVVRHRMLKVPHDTRWRTVWEGRDSEQFSPFLWGGIQEFQELRRGRGVGSDMYLRIARAKLALNSPHTGQAFDEAIAVFQRTNQLSSLFYSHLGKAEWLQQQGEFRQALTQIEEAIDILEGLRDSIDDIGTKVGLLLDKESVYGTWLEYGQKVEQDPEQAFTMAERAKARNLLESVSTGVYEAKLDHAALGETAIGRSNIVRIMRRHFTENIDLQTSDEYLAHRRRLSGAFQSAYRPRSTEPRRAGATPEQIRQVLGENEIFVHYLVSDQQIHAVPVTHNEIHKPLLISVTKGYIEDLLYSFRLERSTFDDCLSLMELHRCLIDPLKPLLEGHDHILLSPHNILHSVPFHALRCTDGRYVIEDFSVSYIPSAALAYQIRTDIKTHSLAGKPSSAFGIGTTSYLPLGKLAATTVEIEAICDLLDSCNIYTGEEARRANLFELEPEQAVLHFACHGEFDSYDPLLSRLYFADGPVYAYELTRLKVRPDFVVLSACETGIHKRYAGDELFGLVRPFLLLGARAVMATMWKVSDLSTADFMTNFYSELTGSNSLTNLSASLKDSQIKFIHSKKYSHPFYWAPYYLTGAL